jgi:hypothetical protein
MGSALVFATLALACATGPAQAGGQQPGSGGSVFGPHHAPVADAALAQMRGGIALPGYIVDIGLTVDGTIKRADADDVRFMFERDIDGGTDQFTVDGDPMDGPFTTDDGNVRVAVDNTPKAVTTVVQGGAGNTVSDTVADDASGVITAVQNNLNNVSIGVTNSIEIKTTKSLQDASMIDAALQRVSDVDGLR